jgi:GT2 family glycosyltransferase
MVNSLALIPTRNRPGDLADCVKAIGSQVDKVIVVDNRSDPPVRPEDHGDNVWVLYCPDDPPNISRLWNAGLQVAASYTNGEPHSVAVLNDDCVVPAGWFEAVDCAMRGFGAVAGSSDPHGQLGELLIHHQPGPVDLRWRLCGYAFVLAGEVGLRADESLAWFYGDDDLDWRARQAGGVVIVPGFPVEHRWPNAQTNARPELVAQTGRDRARFAAKWGRTPW